MFRDGCGTIKSSSAISVHAPFSDGAVESIFTSGRLWSSDRGNCPVFNWGEKDLKKRIDSKSLIVVIISMQRF